MASSNPLAAQGERYMAEGNVNAAAQTFQQLIQEDPNSVPGLLGLTRCLIMAATQDPALAETAVALLDKAESLEPKNAEVHIYRGVLEESQGKLQNARKLYEKGNALNPKLFVGHFNLGRVAGQQGDWALAVRELEKALQIDPENGEALYSVGIAYKESGQRKKAIQAFQKFVEVVRNLDGYMTLFDVMSEDDDFTALSAVLEQATTLFGEEVPILDRQMGLALRAGWHHQILDLGHKLAGFEPKVWLQIAKVTLRQNAYPIAEQAARLYLELDPQSWEAHYYLALCEDEQGQTAAAEPYYRKAIEFGRDHWQSYNNLGTNLVDDPDPRRIQEGVDLLLKAKVLTEPNLSAPRFNLARGYYRLGQVDKAISTCKEILQKGHPSDPIVQTTGRFLAALEQEQENNRK